MPGRGLVQGRTAAGSGAVAETRVITERRADRRTNGRNNGRTSASIGDQARTAAAPSMLAPGDRRDDPSVHLRVDRATSVVGPMGRAGRGRNSVIVPSARDSKTGRIGRLAFGRTILSSVPTIARLDRSSDRADSSIALPDRRRPAAIARADPGAPAATARTGR
jgi:hypothetical protein